MVAGFVSVMLTLLTVVLFFVLAAFPDVDQTSAAVVSNVSAAVVAIGVALWIYTYAAEAVFDPATGFARAAFETVRQVPTKATGWEPSSDVAFANASGIAARALFRVITGRRVNVALRPDVTAKVTSLVEAIMVVAPPTGDSYWAKHTDDAHRYAALLHDINAMIAIGRVGLVARLIDENVDDLKRSGIIVEPGAPETARFLHPLGGRTVFDATAQYLLPVLAFAASVTAIIMAWTRP